VFVLDQGDGLWHTIRRADGSWPFRWGMCGLEKVLRRSDANLTGAELRDAEIAADLTNVSLSDADLGSANPTGSNLTDADLSNANLSGAILAADFSKAALTETNVTEAQLARCLSLEGATMPDGQKYEYWLKDQ
jgi:uncharacterized protein YjbI with pentapeptide repeats